MEFCVCFRSDGSEYWDSNEVCLKFKLKIKRQIQLRNLTLFWKPWKKIQKINFIFLFFLWQGKNYRIIKKRSAFASHSPGILMMDDQKFTVNLYGGSLGGIGDQQQQQQQQQKNSTKTTNPIAIPNGKYNDLTQSKMTSYSEFASWNHLDNECPYWWNWEILTLCVER